MDVVYQQLIDEIPPEHRWKIIDEIFFDDEAFLSELPPEMLPLVKKHGIKAAKDFLGEENNALSAGQDMQRQLADRNIQ